MTAFAARVECLGSFRLAAEAEPGPGFQRVRPAPVARLDLDRPFVHADQIGLLLSRFDAELGPAHSRDRVLRLDPERLPRGQLVHSRPEIAEEQARAELTPRGNGRKGEARVLSDSQERSSGERNLGTAAGLRLHRIAGLQHGAGHNRRAGDGDRPFHQRGGHRLAGGSAHQYSERQPRHSEILRSG